MIPAFVICRNHVTNAKRSFAQLSRFPSLHPIILDMHSSYPAMLEWLDTLSGANCFRVGSNLGCWGLWDRDPETNKTIIEQIIDNFSRVFHITDRFFCLTDDDLDYSGIPDDFIDVLCSLLNSHHGRIKAGCALRIDDIPDDYPLKHRIPEDQNRFWANQIGEVNGAPVYDAFTDTTFCMYRRSDLLTIGYRGWGDCLRIGGRYQARHLGWYKTINTMTEEDWYCLSQTDQASSYWSASLKIHCINNGMISQ